MDDTPTNAATTTTDATATNGTEVAGGGGGGENKVEVNEQDRYWNNVNENPSDFSSWTYLIQLVEKQGDIEEIIRVYDPFLAEFPLCYVYWKKYADHYTTRGSAEKAAETFERGVASIPHSVDLWTYYCTFYAEKFEDLDHIRSLWERGASAIGLDFVAHTFWDKYLEFENSQEDFSRVTALYLRILNIPLDQLGTYFEKFKAHANSRPLAELMDQTEAATLLEEKAKQEAKYADLSKEKGESIDSSEVTAAGVKTGDEVELEFRAKVIANKEALYRRTLDEVGKRRHFEHVILKRPYFHVKPLEDNLLATWRKYLVFEEGAGDVARVIKLYERCLIACCYYSEFWLKYTRWLEERCTADEARSVYYRATSIFLKKRPDVHLAYAIFEEAHNDPAKARQVYENLVSTLPGHAESTLHFVSFERRQNNHEAACAIFDSALSITSLDASSGPFLTMHYARFLEKVLNNAERAREVFNKAVQKFPEHKNLWLAYIQFETSRFGIDSHLSVETNVQNLYNRAVADDSKLTPAAKLELWQNYLEFFATWCSDVKSYRKLCDAFQQAYPTAKSHNKKRPLESESNQQSKHARTSLLQNPVASVPQATTPNLYSYYPQYNYNTAGYAATGYAQYPYDPQTYAAAYANYQYAYAHQ